MAILAVLTALVASYTLTRSGHSYDASASILVSPIPQSDSALLGLGAVTDSGDPARNVQTAAALVDTPQSAAATARRLGSGWSTAGVQNAVSVTPLGQSDVLSITATASSAEVAARVANAYVQAAVQQRANVVQHNISSVLSGLESRLATLRTTGSAGSEAADLATRIGELRAAQSTGGDPSLSASQPAVPPTSPTGAPRWLIVLLSLIGGFAVASVAALGLEYFSGPVRDEEELTSLFPAPVLAYVPRVRRARRGPLSPWQFPPYAFEQVRMLRVQLGLALESPMIMVTSAGAGDGKTTLVAALAAAFAETGQNVIVMDLDLRKPSLEAVLEIDRASGHQGGNDRPAGALISVPKLPNVKLVPLPPVNRATLDEFMRRLPMLLYQARRAAGCVILDTSPIGEVSEALRIAPMCETVLFVSRPRHTNRRHLVLARDLLRRAGASVSGLVVVGASIEEKTYGSYSSYADLEPGRKNAEERARAAELTQPSSEEPTQPPTGSRADGYS